MGARCSNPLDSSNVYAIFHCAETLWSLRVWQSAPPQACWRRTSPQETIFGELFLPCYCVSCFSMICIVLYCVVLYCIVSSYTQVDNTCHPKCIDKKTYCYKAEAPGLIHGSPNNLESNYVQVKRPKTNHEYLNLYQVLCCTWYRIVSNSIVLKCTTRSSI